jgi:DNA mismatch repair protein MutL
VTTIQILDDRLISQIAAGEVVERPASVVKELVENSVDAGARSIRVELEAGGKRSIRVTDDGVGMDRDDALLAFDRHATSKIGSFDDLQGVATLGFRGEALAAISAVARVELTSATEPGEGHRIRIDGGHVRSVEPAACPTGTVVEVRSLFFNVPARRKFLKTVRTELRRATEVVQGYALARPEIGFTLLHEGRTLLDTPPAGEDLEAARRRVGELFGAPASRELVEFSQSGPGGERIWGLVGNRQQGRGRRIFTFVNRRLLRDRTVMAAFYRSVRETWRSEDFPALFLFLDIPPEEVDVNVHPQKAEVRFRDGRFFGRLSSCLQGALERARGEETAPLEEPEGVPGTPLVWQGLGQRKGGWYGEGRVDGGESEVRELENMESAKREERLADVAFAPLVRSPVPLSGRSGEARPFRLLGQYKGTLILLEGPDGLYLVDQHVAHERVLYERFRRQLAETVVRSQRLLEPILLELAPAESMRLSEMATELERLGFSLGEMSGNVVAVSATPAVLTPRLAEQMLASLAGDTGEIETTVEDLKVRLLEVLAASQSCRAAVKMHHQLSAEEMEALVTELFAAEQPFACPHGRPIVLKMADIELERRFGRR